MLILIWETPLQLTRRAAFTSGRIVAYPGPLLFAQVRGVAQLVASADVYVLDLYEEVNVGVLLRWLFRLVLFRVLVSLWRIVRRH